MSANKKHVQISVWISGTGFVTAFIYQCVYVHQIKMSCLVLHSSITYIKNEMILNFVVLQ